MKLEASRGHVSFPEDAAPDAGHTSLDTPVRARYLRTS
jgi:hypothetical protein